MVNSPSGMCSEAASREPRAARRSHSDWRQRSPTSAGSARSDPRPEARGPGPGAPRMTDIILGIDTTTEACSVALAVGGHVRQMLVIEPRGHLAQVPRMIAALLAEAGVSRADIGNVVVSRGPGSFTGVRIGIGYAQGLAFGLDVPLLGVSTLAALAQGAARRGGRGATLVALDARMGELYWAAFELTPLGVERLSDDALAAPAVLQLPRAAAWSAVGPGAVVHAATLRATLGEDLMVEAMASLPEARDLIACAAAGVASPLGGVPVYLRDEVVSRP